MPHSVLRLILGLAMLTRELGHSELLYEMMLNHSSPRDRRNGPPTARLVFRRKHSVEHSVSQAYADNRLAASLDLRRYFNCLRSQTGK